MSVGTLLVIIAAILVIVAMAIGYTADGVRRHRSYLVLCIAVLLICIALCVGVVPFVRT
jgi:hypothetical protein